MLIVKAPIELRINSAIVPSQEAFYRRIVGNYKVMQARIEKEDLLHMMTAPPEIYLGEGSMANVVNDVRVENIQETRMEVVNNFLNRVVLTGKASLTYQDRVYITSVLNRLGIQNVAQFMEQVSKLKEETRSTKQLIDLYWEHMGELTKLLEEYRESKKGKAGNERRTEDGRSFFLHEEIMGRLQTGAVYQILDNFYGSHHGRSQYVSRSELKLTEQKRVAEHILLNRLQSMASGEKVPLLYSHENFYEKIEPEQGQTSVESANSQITSAVLLELIDSLYLSLYGKQRKGGGAWLEMGNALYQSAENTLLRLKSVATERIHYEASSQKPAEGRSQLNQRQIEAVERLLSLTEEMDARYPEGGEPDVGEAADGTVTELSYATSKMVTEEEHFYGEDGSRGLTQNPKGQPEEGRRPSQEMVPAERHSIEGRQAAEKATKTETEELAELLSLERTPVPDGFVDDKRAELFYHPEEAGENEEHRLKSQERLLELERRAESFLEAVREEAGYRLLGKEAGAGQNLAEELSVKAGFMDRADALQDTARARWEYLEDSRLEERFLILKETEKGKEPESLILEESEEEKPGREGSLYKEEESPSQEERRAPLYGRTDARGELESPVLTRGTEEREASESQVPERETEERREGVGKGTEGGLTTLQGTAKSYLERLEEARQEERFLTLKEAGEEKKAERLVVEEPEEEKSGREAFHYKEEERPSQEERREPLYGQTNARGELESPVLTRETEEREASESQVPERETEERREGVGKGTEGGLTTLQGTAKTYLERLEEARQEERFLTLKEAGEEKKAESLVVEEREEERSGREDFHYKEEESRSQEERRAPLYGQTDARGELESPVLTRETEEREASESQVPEQETEEGVGTGAEAVPTAGQGTAAEISPTAGQETAKAYLEFLEGSREGAEAVRQGGLQEPGGDGKPAGHLREALRILTERQKAGAEAREGQDGSFKGRPPAGADIHMEQDSQEEHIHMGGNQEGLQQSWLEEEKLEPARQELLEIDQRNIENYGLYQEILQDWQGGKKERRIVGRERMRLEGLKALEDPQRLLEEYRKKEKTAQQENRERYARLMNLLPPQTRKIYQTLERYQSAPEAAGQSPSVSQNNLGLLLQDIEQAEKERRAERPDDLTKSALPLVHKSLEGQIDQELIDQLLDRKIKDTRRETAKIQEERKQLAHTVIRQDFRRQEMDKGSQELAELIEQGVKRQVDALSDRIYSKLEKRLQNEKRRRGY